MRGGWRGAWSFGSGRSTIAAGEEQGTGESGDKPLET